MKHYSIVRTMTKLLMPPIMLFALYVQFHGDYGPGGGFQAGVIFAVAFILFTLIFGPVRARQVAPAWVTTTMAAIGVLIYAGVGLTTMLLGSPYLDYDILSHDPHHGQHLGITLVELGVGMTVWAVMVSIFLTFVERGVDHRHEQAPAASPESSTTNTKSRASEPPSSKGENGHA